MMKFLWFILIMALVACAPKRDFYAELDRNLIHIENSSAVRVRGDLPDDILFEEFQAVVYRSDSVKKRIPYKLDIGYGRGNVGTSEFKVFDIAFDENDQANEIVFYRNGVPYQTVNIEYATKGGNVFNVKAFLNKEKELCVANHLNYNSSERWNIHLPGSHPDFLFYYPVYASDPDCKKVRDEHSGIYLQRHYSDVIHEKYNK